MLHPFNVVANFIAAQQVSLTEAAQALLNTSSMGTQQGVYLDATGNRNGMYDLGDFLAVVDRSSTSAVATASPNGRQ
jgi:hypothetical protein